ncbi:MAG: helix-turn-helix domain-containing protein, partial [Chloroflexota bacterium]
MPRKSQRREPFAETDLLTTGQAADALGLRSVNTVKRWVREGALEGFRRGSRILIPRESVVRLQNDSRIRPIRAVQGGKRDTVSPRPAADVLSELRRLSLGGDQSARAAALARTV